MILGIANRHAPDSFEQRVPDAIAARALLGQANPDLLNSLTKIGLRIACDARTLDAAVLATTRLGLRHGRFGDDYHTYHNETHVLELAERRLPRLLDQLDREAPSAADQTALLLFAACHDLRQREGPADGPIGKNETASIAETWRILDTCGFDRVLDRAQYVALELMIAGSTFDARPLPIDLPASNPGTPTRGAFAHQLAPWLTKHVPAWRKDADAVRGARLARLAADLDTANVGEDFRLLCSSALRLCCELEMRAGRQLAKPDSAPTCLDFLGLGQQEYFYALHRFGSREGMRVFSAQKLLNGPRVQETTAALLEHFRSKAPSNGLEVIHKFAELAGIDPDAVLR